MTNEKSARDWAIFMNINDERYSDVERMTAIEHIAYAPTLNTIPKAMMLDVIRYLLTAQQPKVLTLDEVRNGNEIGYVEFKYHWEEGWVKCDFTTHNAENEVIMMFSASKTFYQNTEDYGALWRIWSMEPTIEQRKAVKWDE